MSNAPIDQPTSGDRPGNDASESADGTPRNIVLTGFMGTGKSTVGRLLAHRLGLKHVDTDHMIERRHGPIPRIFTSRAKMGFAK